MTTNVTAKPVTFLHETNHDLGQFGDGTCRRWWSQMFYTKKVCFWNTWKIRLQRMFAWSVFLLSF